MLNNGHFGSSLDDFLKQEGIFEQAMARAIQELEAWQVAQTKPCSPLLDDPTSIAPARTTLTVGSEQE